MPKIVEQGAAFGRRAVGGDGACPVRLQSAQQSDQLRSAGLDALPKLP